MCVLSTAANCVAVTPLTRLGEFGFLLWSRNKLFTSMALAAHDVLERVEKRLERVAHADHAGRAAHIAAFQVHQVVTLERARAAVAQRVAVQALARIRRDQHGGRLLEVGFCEHRVDVVCEIAPPHGPVKHFARVLLAQLVHLQRRQLEPGDGHRADELW
eukprot:CAMPEP_0203001236 /NCGR_PEP_ID=MMETSP1401-20130829/423_1 /ASSEMBLY_ACC=CAM_ASM_000894 /TAXON_ID=38833 /ORGANISM="Micromonas pusilla, Strain CCAC1681" /LENGTH=159 /DNA_ID=CAMNT_0049742695 /DNA_START=310 /DNA_END=785 /DNA_ORIENTATION=-